MGQMGETVASIKEGMTLLAGKSSEISGMFSTIRELAEKNRRGAEKLDRVNKSMIEASGKLSEVVKGKRE
jgi:methyl-accepting chemotaxis protein